MKCEVLIALPVVTGDINSGDVSGLVRCQKLEQGRESDALRALLVLRSQLGHGFKGPAAVAGHTDAYAHVLKVAGFTAILEIGTSIWPAIDNAVQAGIAAISSRFPVLGAVLGSLWSTVQKVWSKIQVILQNAIQFVQNVFTGN